MRSKFLFPRVRTPCCDSMSGFHTPSDTSADELLHNERALPQADLKAEPKADTEAELQALPQADPEANPTATDGPQYQQSNDSGQRRTMQPRRQYVWKTQGNPRRFEVRNSLTGEEIILPRCSTKVHENTTLEWLLPQVAEVLAWRVSHVKLTVGQITVAYVHRIGARTETFLKDCPTCGTGVLSILATKMPRPEVFSATVCLCDFGGCCRECNVPADCPCVGCGNNGCCRSGSCGHDCCKRSQNGFTDRCSIPGCRQHWAAQ